MEIELQALRIQLAEKSRSAIKFEKEVKDKKFILQSLV